MIEPHHALKAYDIFAEFYDDFTAHHDDAAWTRSLEGLAIDAGLGGRRLLDVACGTGKALHAMLERGYDVTGCDISPGMLAKAAARTAGKARLETQDMRALPRLGVFDLVWSLGDAVNYLRDQAELDATFTGIARQLAPGGVVVCDVNTIATFRAVYSSLLVRPADNRVVLLDGHGSDRMEPGGHAEVWIERLTPSEGGWWRRERSVHHHFHHPVEAIELAMRRAGLEPVLAAGSWLTGDLDAVADDERHVKRVHVARAER